MSELQALFDGILSNDDREAGKRSRFLQHACTHYEINRYVNNNTSFSPVYASTLPSNRGWSHFIGY